MTEKNNKAVTIVLISIFVLLAVLFFITIKIFQKKQNITLESHFINVRLITSVHPSLPWKFSAKEPNIKIKPGEVKTIEYIVENPSNKTTFGIATFQYHPKELGNYFTKLNCFCFDKQTLLFFYILKFFYIHLKYVYLFFFEEFFCKNYL